MFIAVILLSTLTRAEIVQRMRAPVITQADGLVQVYADCPEDMRREFQGPVGGFAADTAKALYTGLSMKPVRFRKPEILIHIGDVRTNLTAVVARVETNETAIISRIYLPSPGFADLDRFRIELVKAFYRSVKQRELTDAAARRTLRAVDPRLRVADARERLEAWLAGRPAAPEDGEEPLTPEARDEEGLRLMRSVIEPGVASRRDVLIFASRLYLYPRTFDEKFVGGSDCLSFREAISLAEVDPRIRFLAYFKANELLVWGGGRGEMLEDAAKTYHGFLLALAGGERTKEELGELLDDADLKLRKTYDAIP